MKHLRVSIHHILSIALHIMVPRVVAQHTADKLHEVLNGQTHIVVVQFFKCIECIQHILLRSIFVTMNALDEPTLKKSAHMYFFLSSTFPKSNSCNGFFFCKAGRFKGAFSEKAVAALPKRCANAINGCREQVGLHLLVRGEKR